MQPFLFNGICCRSCGLSISANCAQTTAKLLRLNLIWRIIRRTVCQMRLPFSGVLLLHRQRLLDSGSNRILNWNSSWVPSLNPRLLSRRKQIVAMEKFIPISILCNNERAFYDRFFCHRMLWRYTEPDTRCSRLVGTADIIGRASNHREERSPVCRRGARERREKA